MKKLAKIKLHQLSQAEMIDKELNMLVGGFGSGSSKCACAAVCLSETCSCSELVDGSGVYLTSNLNRSGNEMVPTSDTIASKVASANHEK